MLLQTQAPSGALFHRRFTLLASHPPFPNPNPFLFSKTSKIPISFLSKNLRKNPFNLIVANAETRSDSASSATKQLLPPPSFNNEETVFIGAESFPSQGVNQFDKPNSYLQFNKWGGIGLLSGGDVLALLLFSAIGSHSFPVLGMETLGTADASIAEQHVEFDYKKGSGKGPESWGDIHEEWAACKNGNLQSPIDLLQERVEIVPELGNVKKSYKPANATLKKKDHNILLHWVLGSAGSIQIDGTEYALDQCHWHSPSEHTINGKRFGLELHMVHRNLELNKTAVIGALYNITAPDPFISKLEKDIWNIPDSEEEVNIGVVDPAHIKNGSTNYYRYLGSLTTPPCTEGVIWTIDEELSTVSQEQITLLRTAVHDNEEYNARPLQQLNDRNMFFYRPESRTLPTISLDDIK